VLQNIVINAVAPYVTYLALRHFGVGTVHALTAGAVFPVTSIIVGFVRERRVQALGVIVLTATVASIAGALYFTSPFLALAKGSLLTGALGIAFAVSLFGRRPLVFYLAAMGADADLRQESETKWQMEPAYRRVMRRITAVWAAALFAEATLRVVLIPLLPIAVFLPVSEAMWICCFLLMILWSWRYAERVMAREQGAI
jgi:hypothetical protein